jgi:hypothetical protein
MANDFPQNEDFAVLHSVQCNKGHLSPLLRCAWDSGDLRSLDGLHPIQATGTHISLIAHITQRELAQNLHPGEAHNGFANRCLWTGVQRSQCLPDGGNMDAHELSAVAAELRRPLEWVGAAHTIRLVRDDAARALWHDCYPALSQIRPGLHGAATSRPKPRFCASAPYTLSSTAPHHRAASPSGCPRRVGLLWGKRLPLIRHSHRRPHRRPDPRSHQRVHRRLLVQKSDECPLPRPSQQQPH